MAGKKVEILEGEIGQLKSDLEGKFFEIQNQIFTNKEKMEGKFAIMEEMLKKLLEVKITPATSEARGTNGDHGRRGNPNQFKGRENPDVEILEGENGMPPLEPLSMEEISTGLHRRPAEFARKRENFYHHGADFERGRGEFALLKVFYWIIGQKKKQKTRKILTEKIAQLNSAIDDVSSQLRADDDPNGAVVASGEIEASV
ncbi:hypothetical protein M5K25_001681 [Dendrobium thyrsiflorum]|uniref:Uncharacterized protein n=1 Tax=Dendrobium thyrsiflorum TaxID=117978 RepID=A0ABD0VYY8_DENTH